MLTLTQLYELGQNVHTDIFSGIMLPDDSPLDRDTLINSIMERCGLNIPLYSDPYVMTSAINLWSAKNQYTFRHVGKIYNAEYSPIENKDLYSETIEDKNRDLTDDTTGSNKKKDSLKADNTTTHSGTDNTTVENTTSAYNSSSYQPDSKETSYYNHGEKVDNTGNSTHDINTDITNNKKVKEKEGTKTIIREHGNVGVTSNTQLQTEEYGLLGQFNPYSFIAGLFENELTLFVY